MVCLFCSTVQEMSYSVRLGTRFRLGSQARQLIMIVSNVGQDLDNPAIVQVDIFQFRQVVIHGLAQVGIGTLQSSFRLKAVHSHSPLSGQLIANDAYVIHGTAGNRS